MGLLDEAIREHLELKRRRGADPGEVAREQREALEPDERQAIAERDEGAELEQPPADGAGQGLDLPEAGLMAGGVPEDMPDDLTDTPQGAQPGAPGMDETAELDMRTVLGEEPAGTGEDTTPGVAGGVRPASDAGAPSSREDSLDWEMPGDEAGAEPAGGKSGEDVLEETPEFLRDAPEQDRLWFEQRPPRDFDFDFDK